MWLHLSVNILDGVVCTLLVEILSAQRDHCFCFRCPFGSENKNNDQGVHAYRLLNSSPCAR